MNFLRAEFLNDVRIHDQHGTHTAQEGHRPSGRQSAEDRQGDTEGGGDGTGAERASASGDVGGVCQGEEYEEVAEGDGAGGGEGGCFVIVNVTL